MSSITFEPRAVGPRGGNRPASKCVPRAIDARGSDDEVNRRGDTVEFSRVLAVTLALYASLIAMPLLAPVPFVLTGLFLGVIVTLFGGIT